MKKIFAIFTALIVFFSCSPKEDYTTVITVKGSTTMYMLTNLLAQRYMKSHPDITIHTESGGTGDGVEALIEGKADICAASRMLTPEETKKMAMKYQTVGMAHRIALDALCFYTNRDNTVKSLTMENIKDIFSCKIRYWNEVGGDSAEIHTVVRPPGSGTRKHFETLVLEGEEICSKTTPRSTGDSVIFEVFADVDAIGYGGFGYSRYVNYLEIDSIAPTPENIKSHTYPIIRYLYFYTVDKPEGETKKFIEWVMSPAGRRLIRQAGYIPLY